MLKNYLDKYFWTLHTLFTLHLITWGKNKDKTISQRRKQRWEYASEDKYCYHNQTRIISINWAIQLIERVFKLSTESAVENLMKTPSAMIEYERGEQGWFEEEYGSTVTLFKCHVENIFNCTVLYMFALLHQTLCWMQMAHTFLHSVAMFAAVWKGGFCTNHRMLSCSLPSWICFCWFFLSWT